MASVELRDIVTEADRAAALALRVAPGQDAFVASVEDSFADAVKYPKPAPASGRSTTLIGTRPSDSR
jgi:diamine N-acetyltransferase